MAREDFRQFSFELSGKIYGLWLFDMHFDENGLFQKGPEFNIAQRLDCNQQITISIEFIMQISTSKQII